MRRPRLRVRRLPSPVASGDWHDKLLRWEITDGLNRQMFSTKRDADHFGKLWRRYGNMQAAIDAGARAAQ